MITEVRLQSKYDMHKIKNGNKIDESDIIMIIVGSHGL